MPYASICHSYVQESFYIGGRHLKKKYSPISRVSLFTLVGFLQAFLGSASIPPRPQHNKQTLSGDTSPSVRIGPQREGSIEATTTRCGHIEGWV